MYASLSLLCMCCLISLSLSLPPSWSVLAMLCFLMSCYTLIISDPMVFSAMSCKVMQCNAMECNVCLSLSLSDVMQCNATEGSVLLWMCLDTHAHVSTYTGVQSIRSFVLLDSYVHDCVTTTRGKPNLLMHHLSRICSGHSILRSARHFIHRLRLLSWLHLKTP